MAKKYQLKVKSTETVALEPVEVKIEATSDPLEPFQAVSSTKTYTAGPNDTWAVLGAKYKPEGKTGFQHATYLHKLNNGATLHPGMIVKL